MSNEKTAEQWCDELRAERDEALARCAAWEQESESNRKRICRMLELDERTPASSLMNAIGMLVSGAKARAEWARLECGRREAALDAETDDDTETTYPGSLYR